MIWEAWLTLGVIALCFGTMVTNRIAPDIVMMGGVTILLVSGVLSPAEALGGLANEGLITVAVLYVVVSGLQETGGIAWIVQSLLGRPRSLANAQLKMMTPVAALSAFLNNTPVVAVFLPAIKEWAALHRMSVSKLMIPLSYAAIAGGTCTLIGTSTNLVVNGLLISETDLPRLAMFDIAWIGVPVVVAVFCYLVAVSNTLLPDRRPAIGDFSNVREYTVEMLVEPASPLVGKSIEEANLRRLPGMYLIEVERDQHVITAVSPEERLREHDRLVFVGVVESVVHLQKIRGLKPATDQVFKLDPPHRERCLSEAVISNSSPLVGKNVREGQFRTRYNAAIIAVARNGVKIKDKIGDIVLRPGDTLLIVSHPWFAEHYRNSRDFFLVSRLDNARPPRHERGVLAMGILGAMVVSVALGWLSMLQAAMLAAGLMIVTRCTRGSVARNAVDWQVLIVIAASFAIGNALQKSGAAGTIAEQLIGLSAGMPWLALTIVYLVTSIFTALATNNAAAVVMFPIALATAQSLNVSFLPFAITLMIAASAAFATPIGYQTNLMVFGAGGYRFSDYGRIGVPLTALICFITVLITPLVWPF